jgi:ATP-binding cassette, subfamily F, member 3
MIQLQGAGKRFGHKLLFENCDWLITPKEKTGWSARTAPANRRC